MTTRNAIKYAEGNLGVHEEYAKLNEVTQRANLLRTEVASLEVSLRVNEDAVNNLEFQIMSDLRANFVGSEAAFERDLKLKIGNSEMLRKDRATILTMKCRITEKTAELKNLEATARMLITRLNELGGLLRFYASAKDAITVGKMIVADPANNWP